MRYDCLIVEDETMFADSAAEYFNLFGVRTAVVYDFAGCRSFWEVHTADLMLLDINLGEESGFALCRELREKTQAPILFLSARTSDDDKILALNIGGDDYIQNPLIPLPRRSRFIRHMLDDRAINTDEKENGQSK